MDHQTFDSLVRRAALSRDRRSTLGLLTGAVLAAAAAPGGASATLGGDKPKNECDDKKDRKKAKKRVKKCQNAADLLCLTHLDFVTALSCSLDFEECCEFGKACQFGEMGTCADDVKISYGL